MRGPGASPSPQAQARLVGALYLAVILTGAFAEAFVRNRLVVPGDAAATARAILAHETLFRAGFAAQLLTVLFDLPLVVLLYGLLKGVDRILARTMLAFSLVAVAVETASLVQHLAPLALLQSHALGAFQEPQVQALAYASLRLQPIGFTLCLAFFGVDLFLTGWLCVRSGFIPRAVGALLALAGLCYAANSFLVFLAPGLADRLLPWILLPCLVGEGTFSLWMLVKGVDAEAWAARHTGSRATLEPC